MKNNEKITAKDTIGDVLTKNGNLSAILTGFGMHCLGCPMSMIETLEEAAAVHDINLKLMLQKLNEANKSKP